MSIWRSGKPQNLLELVIFQRHTFSRLEKMYNDFLNAFKAADYLVVSNVYAAREEGDNAEVALVLAEAIECQPTIYESTQNYTLRDFHCNAPYNFNRRMVKTVVIS